MGIETALLAEFVLPAAIGAGGSAMSSIAGAKGGGRMEGFGEDRVKGAMDAAQGATQKGMGMAEDRMYDDIPYPQWDVSGMLGETNIPGLSIPLGLNPEIQGILDQNPFQQYTPQRPEAPQARPRGSLAELEGPTGAPGRQEGFGTEEGLATDDDKRQALTDVSMLIQELMKKQGGGGGPKDQPQGPPYTPPRSV